MTPDKRYEYRYKINQISLFSANFNLCVRIGDNRYSIVGMATVTITQHDIMRGDQLVSECTELRYVIIGDRHEPDVSYREHPEYKGVEISIR